MIWTGVCCKIYMVGGWDWIQFVDLRGTFWTFETIDIKPKIREVHVHNGKLLAHLDFQRRAPWLKWQPSQSLETYLKSKLNHVSSVVKETYRDSSLTLNLTRQICAWRRDRRPRCCHWKPVRDPLTSTFLSLMVSGCCVPSRAM